MKQKQFLASLPSAKKKLWICHEESRVRRWHPDGCIHRVYTFGVLQPSDPVPSKPKQVWIGPWPELYESQSPGFLGQTGRITYQIEGTRACTLSYYPKSFGTVPYYPKSFGPAEQIHGLGYYLEYLATQDLRRSGVKYISTSEEPNTPRVMQLHRVGLPIFADTPIVRWMEGLIRGIKNTKEACQEFFLSAV